MKNRATVFSENLSAIAERGFVIVPLLDSAAMADSKPLPFDEYVEALATYAENARIANGQSYEDIPKLATKRGGSISKSTAQEICKGQTPNPSIYKLVSLALGLNRDVEELITVALGGEAIESPVFKRSQFANLATLYERLPAAEQRMMKRFYQMMEREMVRILMQQEDDLAHPEK
jgi:transcriptional regulator with XRE-family HTH domain